MARETYLDMGASLVLVPVTVQQSPVQVAWGHPVLVGALNHVVHPVLVRG